MATADSGDVLPHLRTEAIRAVVGPTSADRGFAVAASGAVGRLRYDAATGRLSASVQGTAPSPYRVQVQLQEAYDDAAAAAKADAARTGATLVPAFDNAQVIAGQGTVMAEIIDELKGAPDVVIVDVGFALEDDEELSYDTRAPRRNATTLITLESAEQVVVVGSGDPVGLQRLVRASQDLGGIPSGRPLVVVNRVRASAVGADPQARIVEALGRFAGMEDLHLVPEDRETLDRLLLQGRVLAEGAPRSPAREAIRALAARVAVDNPLEELLDVGNGSRLLTMPIETAVLADAAGASSVTGVVAPCSASSRDAPPRRSPTRSGRPSDRSPR